MTKVSVVKCDNYDYLQLKKAIIKALDLIGGIGKFIKRGDKVLLKPNLLSARPPQTAIDTHPAVVEVLSELVKETGGIPYIGDSPGGFEPSIEYLWEITGIKGVAERTGARLLKFEHFEKFSTGLPGIREIPVAREVMEMDVIISIPKFKSHSLTVLTGAVKNMYGVVAGLTKTELHKEAPAPEFFSEMILEVFSRVSPHLSIMDGVIGLEGDGPGSAGKIRPLGLIMASSDAVALDTVMALLAGITPDKVPIIDKAREKGIGESNFKKIEVLGENLNDVKINDFILPGTSFRGRLLEFLPKFLIKIVAGLYRVYPYINKNCIKCGVCVKSCPVEAIGCKKSRLLINYKRCILCLCCLEVCPHKAVILKKSLLAKMI